MNLISVIGLGKAGLPLAAIIADSGFRVVGVDVDKKRCEMINRGVNPIPEEIGLDELIKIHGGKTLFATNNYEDARDCGLFIIIVPLYIDSNHIPDFSILESAFRSVGRIIKEGDIVVLETTVPPMTTEILARKWLEEESGLSLGDFYLAYSPERIMTGYSISRLKEFPKVIGGVDEESGRRAYNLYKNFIPNLKLVSNARTAEFIKIIEGCYRDVNVALANELFKIAEEIGVDFYEAREYANHEFCHIHLPSTGVGGHCIPVYPWFLINEMERREEFSKARLLRTAREINDEMLKYWSEKIILKSLEIDKPLKDIKICIKGITFREGVKEIYHSRNLAIAEYLRKKGFDVGVYDELFTAKEIEEMGLKWLKPEEADLILDCFNLSITVR